MKIAVFSDSHGSLEPMVSAVKRFQPERIIHLGDYARDAGALSRRFPDIPLDAVRGNCDLPGSGPETLSVTLGGVPVFLTHGHRYGVKTDLLPLLNAAHFSGAALALFGHTHQALDRQFSGIRLLNPGSCGQGSAPSFALLDVGAEGTVSAEIIRL